MSTQVALPFGWWQVSDPRASGRATINCFSELSPQTAPADSKQAQPPAYLRRAPGITTLTTNAGSSVTARGVWEMAGVTYVVIGSKLYTLTSAGVLTQIATGVSGSGFVRMTDNGNCLVILIPGTTTCYTYCPNGGGFATLSASGFTTYGAIDCWFCDSFIVFLALNGKEFFNDDGAAVSGTGQITFNSAAVFPRELATDLFIGMAVDHRQVTMFGERTSEGYLNVGNATGSPFGSAPQSFMQIGMHPLGAYTAVVQDQTVFWLANDLTVRRRNGQTPTRVSHPGVESLLATSNLKGIYGLAYSIAGHLMYALTAPAAGWTIVYDCTTGEWHEMSSLINNIGYWRPAFIYNTFGMQLVCDSQTGSIGYLDPTASTEFGNPMACTIQTQSVYDAHNRISHRRVEIIITAGESTSLTTGANITCFVSNDGGRIFHALPMCSLGAAGQYSARAYWFNVGLSRDRVYKFVVSDPTPLFAVDIQAELQGGRW